MDRFINRLADMLENLFNNISMNFNFRENIQALFGAGGLTTLLATAIITTIFLVIKWRITGNSSGRGCIGFIGTLIFAYVCACIIVIIIQIATGIPLKIFN